MKTIGITNIQFLLLLGLLFPITLYGSATAQLVVDQDDSSESSSESDRDNECGICFENHIKEQDQNIIHLVCNHSFGAKCLLPWVQKNRSCPICRDVFMPKPKASSSLSLACSVCHQRIEPEDKSCFYTCVYKGDWNWQKEKHYFHEECIREYAEKASFISRRTFCGYEKAGEIVFTCPVQHNCAISGGCLRPRVKLEAFLKRKPVGEFPEEPKANVQDVCEICHSKVKDDEEQSSYTCTWDAGSWWGGKEKKNHLFHKACLQSYAEKNAQRLDNGEIVFYCPVDHGGVKDHKELYVPLLDGFEAQYAHHSCTYCMKRVEPEEDPSVVALEYDDYPVSFGIRMLTKVTEKHYYHKACLAIVARTARQVKSSDGAIKYMHPCACHEDTPLAHEFHVPSHLLPSEEAI